jgi:hypothetical protein
MALVLTVIVPFLTLIVSTIVPPISVSPVPPPQAPAKGQSEGCDDD